VIRRSIWDLSAAPSGIKRESYIYLPFLVTVYSWKLSRSKRLSNAANNHINGILLLSNDDVLDQRYFEDINQSDEACFYLPVLKPGEPVVFPGQCDETIPAVPNFNVSRVSIHTKSLIWVPRSLRANSTLLPWPAKHCWTIMIHEYAAGVITDARLRSPSWSSSSSAHYSPVLDIGLSNCSPSRHRLIILNKSLLESVRVDNQLEKFDSYVLADVLLTVHEYRYRIK
jgi:hypothetical protein